MSGPPSLPGSFVASSLGEGGSDALAAARSLVAELATLLETRQASQALVEGNRRAAEGILSIADRLRALAQEDSKASGSTAGVGRPCAVGATREQAEVVADKAKRPPGRGSARAVTNRTEFHRSGNQLVKHGMVGTSKAYRHLAPLALVDRIAMVAEGLMRRSGEFGFDDVAAALPNDRGYQIRVVIAWMRSVELLSVRIKGRYVSSPGLPARAAEEVAGLRAEAPAGSRSSERAQAAGKSDARRKRAGKTSNRRKRTRAATD
jgi:hypothetical protein